MNWLDKLKLVQLLRTVMVSVDERWDIADIQFDAVYFLVLLCGFSILSYCLDIYQLVKRTTMPETLIGMLLPGMAALSGAVWLTEYGGLPSAQALAELAGQPFSLALSVQLAACAVLFAFVFNFCEEPLFRDEEYTLTRNFLVEEKNFAGIFYLGDLRYLPSGWMYDGKKWLRVINFRDGSKISLEKGKQNSEEIFRGIDRYAKSYGIAESRVMADGITKTQKAYTDNIKGQLLAVWTVVMMLILTVVMMDGLGAWG